MVYAGVEVLLNRSTVCKNSNCKEKMRGSMFGKTVPAVPVVRVEVETQEKGNIGNKPGFFACFVSKKQ